MSDVGSKLNTTFRYELLAYFTVNDHDDVFDL